VTQLSDLSDARKTIRLRAVRYASWWLGDALVLSFNP
jgi:hypothetical protein